MNKRKTPARKEKLTNDESSNTGKKDPSKTKAGSKLENVEDESPSETPVKQKHGQGRRVRIVASDSDRFVDNQPILYLCIDSMTLHTRILQWYV